MRLANIQTHVTILLSGVVGFPGPDGSPGVQKRGYSLLIYLSIVFKIMLYLKDIE